MAWERLSEQRTARPLPPQLQCPRPTVVSSHGTGAALARRLRGDRVKMVYRQRESRINGTFCSKL